MVSATRNSGASTLDRSLPKPARVLAIDYGRRRIGLAVSDELGVTARPLATMERKNRREDLRRLRDLARKSQVSAILVGYPIHMSGESGEMSIEAEQFAARIRKELGLPVKLQDERLTSWEAEQVAQELGLGKNADIDSLSAAILLREYLNNSQNHKKSRRSVHV
jgi:putative holliday junction resolvase